jgi:hypothetical protein
MTASNPARSFASSERTSFTRVSMVSFHSPKLDRRYRSVSTPNTSCPARARNGAITEPM